MTTTVHECSRTFSRNNEISVQAWREFFTKNPTPWVYLDAKDDSELFSEKNIVAFVKNVDIKDWGFTYELIIINDSAMGEDPLYDPYATMEPVFGTINRYNKETVSVIFGLEIVTR